MIADYTQPFPYDFPIYFIPEMDSLTWGRSYSFNGSGDQGIVMPPRAYYFRDFNFGSWTDVSIGFAYCACETPTEEMDSFQADTVNEVENPISVSNLFHFGLIKKGLQEVDMNNLTQFVGMRSLMGGNSQLFGPPTKQLVGLQATLVQQSHEQLQGSTISIPLPCGVSFTPFALFGIRLSLNKSSGQLVMNFNTQTAVEDTVNDMRTVLKDFLLAIPNTATGSARTFNGIYSTAPFSSYFIYWPFLLNRLKLQAVGGVKIG